MRFLVGIHLRRASSLLSPDPTCLKVWKVIKIVFKAERNRKVSTAVEESVQRKIPFNKHKIAVRKIKRLETVVKTQAKPSTPALVGRPRTEPPISTEEERKRKQNMQSSQRKSRKGAATGDEGLSQHPRKIANPRCVNPK